MSNYFKVQAIVRDAGKVGNNYDNPPQLPTAADCSHINTVTIELLRSKGNTVDPFFRDIISQISEGAAKNPFPNCGDGQYAGGGQVVAVGLHDGRDKGNDKWILDGNVVNVMDELWEGKRHTRYILEIRVRGGEFLEED